MNSEFIFEALIGAAAATSLAYLGGETLLASLVGGGLLLLLGDRKSVV